MSSNRTFPVSFFTVKTFVVRKYFFVAAIILLSPCLLNTGIFAQLPSFLIPPTEFKAFDTPNDAGETISLTWSISPSDAPDVFYVVYIDKDKNGDFEKEAIRIKSNASYRTAAPEKGKQFSHYDNPFGHYPLFYCSCAGHNTSHSRNIWKLL